MHLWPRRNAIQYEIESSGAVVLNCAQDRERIDVDHSVLGALEFDTTKQHRPGHDSGRIVDFDLAEINLYLTKHLRGAKDISRNFPKNAAISITFGTDFPMMIEYEFADGKCEILSMIGPPNPVQLITSLTTLSDGDTYGDLWFGESFIVFVERSEDRLTTANPSSVEILHQEPWRSEHTTQYIFR